MPHGSTAWPGAAWDYLVAEQLRAALLSFIFVRMAAEMIFPQGSVQSYVPKAEVVEAAQLSSENVEEISEWLNGKGYRIGSMSSDPSKTTLKISHGHALSGDKVLGGQWIVVSGNGYKIVEAADFDSEYDLA